MNCVIVSLMVISIFMKAHWSSGNFWGS